MKNTKIKIKSVKSDFLGYFSLRLCVFALLISSLLSLSASGQPRSKTSMKSINSNYATVNLKNGVSILPLDDEEFVYITMQFKYAVGRDSLEVVAGAVEEGEDLGDSAKREALEEVGIEAREITELGKIDVDTSIIKSKSHLFLARKLSFHEPKREGTEKIETVKMKLDEAVEKVMNGEITHAPSCILILKAFQKVKNVNGKR